VLADMPEDDEQEAVTLFDSAPGGGGVGMIISEHEHFTSRGEQERSKCVPIVGARRVEHVAAAAPDPYGSPALPESPLRMSHSECSPHRRSDPASSPPFDFAAVISEEVSHSMSLAGTSADTTLGLSVSVSLGGTGGGGGSIGSFSAASTVAESLDEWQQLRGAPNHFSPSTASTGSLYGGMATLSPIAAPVSLFASAAAAAAASTDEKREALAHTPMEDQDFELLDG